MRDLLVKVIWFWVKDIIGVELRKLEYEVLWLEKVVVDFVLLIEVL